ncbi:hypothetical protein GCM10009799_12250 [Nocardiopsis rhodophaea]|uniref:Uncharacterized protein n=1 Tax=Nocardiopsis rhodophaea TaxID=280238 RepID=A0ABN2SK71_9ACTN
MLQGTVPVIDDVNGHRFPPQSDGDGVGEHSLVFDHKYAHCVLRFPQSPVGRCRRIPQHTGSGVYNPAASNVVPHPG